MFFFLVRLCEYKLGRDNQQHGRLRSLTKPSNHCLTDTLSPLTDTVSTLLLFFLLYVLIFLIMSHRHRHCLNPFNLPRIFRLLPVILILLILLSTSTSHVLCFRRVWRVLTFFAPSYRTSAGEPLSPFTDTYASDYPFSVRPDTPISPQDLMRIQVRMSHKHTFCLVRGGESRNLMPLLSAMLTRCMCDSVTLTCGRSADTLCA